MMPEPQTLAEMHARAMAARARLGWAPTRPVVARPVAPPPQPPEPVPAPHPQEGRGPDGPKRDFLLIATPKPTDDPYEVIGLVAARHGMTTERLRQNRSSRPHVAARHEAMIAVADAFPLMSIFRIAHDYFGCDHTTMLNAMRRRGRPTNSAERIVAAEHRR